MIIDSQLKKTNIHPLRKLKIQVFLENQPINSSDSKQPMDRIRSFVDFVFKSTGPGTVPVGISKGLRPGALEFLAALTTRARTWRKVVPRGAGRGTGTQLLRQSAVLGTWQSGKTRSCEPNEAWDDRWATKKNLVGWVIYRGWCFLPSFIGIIINHEIRMPINQPV